MGKVGFCSGRTAKLFAGKPQWWATLAFGDGKAAFFAGNVVTRDRHHALAPGELDLRHHHVLLAKRHFRSREIELPHAHKPRLVNAFDIVAVGEKTLAPGFKRFRIMQPKDFDVRDKQPRAFDRRQNLGQGRDVATGEDIFRDPGIGDVGSF